MTDVHTPQADPPGTEPGLAGTKADPAGADPALDPVLG